MARIFVNFLPQKNHPPFLKSSTQAAQRVKITEPTLTITVALSLSYSNYQQPTTYRSCPPLGLFLDTWDSPMIHVVGWAYWIKAVLAQPQFFPQSSLIQQAELCGSGLRLFQVFSSRSCVILYSETGQWPVSPTLPCVAISLKMNSSKHHRMVYSKYILDYHMVKDTVTVHYR